MYLGTTLLYHFLDIQVQHIHMTDTAAADRAGVELIVNTLHWFFPSFDYRYPLLMGCYRLYQLDLAFRIEVEFNVVWGFTIDGSVIPVTALYSYGLPFINRWTLLGGLAFNNA